MREQFVRALPACAHYADIDLRLALRFQDEFESVMEGIVEHPQAFAAAHAAPRRAGQQHVPHGIYFRLVRPDLLVIRGRGPPLAPRAAVEGEAVRGVLVHLPEILVQFAS